MFCLKCGEVIPDESTTCSKCGANLKAGVREQEVAYASQKEIQENDTSTKKNGIKEKLLHMVFFCDSIHDIFSI